MKLLRNRLYLIVVYLTSILLIWIFWDFVVDDAYISYVYSKNLIAGKGLTYNGLLVEGYSNFSWTLIISPFLFIGFDPLLASRLLSVISLGLIILILDTLIRLYLPGIDRRSIGLALLTFSISSTVAAWTVAGLETIFFCLLVVLFIYVEIREPQGKIYLSPIVVLLLALTRPEGMMFVLVLVAYRIYRHRAINRQLVLSSSLFLLPFAVFLFWRYQTFGVLLPNTAYVKLGTSVPSVAQAVEWIAFFFLLRPIYTLVIITSMVILIKRKEFLDQQWVLILLIAGAFVAFVLYAGRDWMPFHRFLAPLVPLFSLIIARLIYPFRTGIARMVVVALVLAIGVYELVISATVFRDQIHDFGAYTRGLLEAGQQIKERTQEDAVIAIEDAGAIAYASERSSVDILGLNNAYIAHHPDLDIAAYVLSYKPEIVQLHLEKAPSGEFTGSKDSRASGLIYQDADFSSCYRLSTEWLDEPYMPYIFIRECR